MANPEHLEILKQGVAVWNRWRLKNSNVEPDLEDADLSNLELVRADLSSALGITSRSNLTRVNLSKSILSVANFHNADLVGANLSEALINSADFMGANLRGANLTKAILWHTDFSNADLSEADLNSASLHSTHFGATILKGAKNLHLCTHLNYSFVDHRTLRLSKNLPLQFLRGCGLPDILIEYIPSILNDPIQFYSCFISYSSKNQLFADRLYADLQNKGVRCWLASEDLKIGDKIRIGIDESIRFHDKLLLVLSKHSVASDWVEQEVETALDRERREKRTVLFPIRLDDTVMKIDTGWPALIRNTRNIGDFRKWKQHDSYRKAFDRLLRDLKAEGKKA